MPERHLRPSFVVVFIATAVLAIAGGCSRRDVRSPASAPALAPKPAVERARATIVTPPVDDGSGADFSREVKALFRVVACADGPLPEGLDEGVVREHCAWMQPRIERYRQRYLAPARTFLAGVTPNGLPESVVYPFGGGDLLSALTTFPAAREFTTLSLELAGDPRRIDHMDRDALARSLAQVREAIAGLLAQNDSTSENLMKGQRGDIPGQLAFFLVALRVHGFEPAGLHYVSVRPDGTLHVLSAAEIANSESKLAHAQHRKWTPPDFSVAFANSELLFRRAGSDEPLRVHRHFGANLSDAALSKSGGLVAHLSAKGDVAAMTKAASYCLWNPGFKIIRRYLLDHAVFMVSDSTGIPPSIAREAGLVQETYGRFHGSFLPASPAINDEFRALWERQPQRPLPIRYGYLDSAKGYHLLVTRRESRP